MSIIYLDEPLVYPAQPRLIVRPHLSVQSWPPLLSAVVHFIDNNSADEVFNGNRHKFNRFV